MNKVVTGAKKVVNEILAVFVLACKRKKDRALASLAIFLQIPVSSVSNKS